MFWDFTLYQLVEAGKRVDVIANATAFGASAVAYIGKYGYLGATIIIPTQELISKNFVPFGFYTLDIFQDDEPIPQKDFDPSGNHIEITGLVCDKVYHHANGYTYLSFKHAAWLALNQICNYAAVTSDKPMSEPELVIQLMKNEKKFEMVDSYDISDKMSVDVNTSLTLRQLQNYEVVGRRWIDVLDEVCYRNRWEWYIVREKSNDLKYSICLGKFPVAWTLKLYGVDLEEGEHDFHEVPSVFPLTSTAHPETLTTIQEVDSFNLVQYNMSYFQFLDAIPSTPNLGPDTVITYLYNESQKSVTPVPQLIFINVSKQSLITFVYNSSCYISPWEYFRVMCPQNEFARERFYDFERLITNIGSQPATIASVYRDDSNKASYKGLVNVSTDVGGPGETDRKYADNEKSVLLKMERMSPFMRSNFGIHFPSPPGGSDNGTDSPECVVLKANGDNAKAVVLGEIMPETWGASQVLNTPNDFALVIPSAAKGGRSYLKHVWRTGLWEMRADGQIDLGVDQLNKIVEKFDENGKPDEQNGKPITLPDGSKKQTAIPTRPGAMRLMLNTDRDISMGAQNVAVKEAITTKSHIHSILPPSANLICIPGSAPAPSGILDTTPAKADTTGQGISTKVKADPT